MKGDFHISLYTPGMKDAWDRFVDASKNGTFLFRRDYMDYHSDRFADMSLVVTDDSGNIIAVLPGNRKGDRFYSHGGLTYGGLVTDEKMSTALCLAIFKEIHRFLASRGVALMRYKAMPHIYHRMLADEDLYAVFRLGGRLVSRNASVAIDLDNPLKMGRSRLNAIKRAIKNGVEIRESDDLASFYDIMCRNMSDRYHAKPTHSLAELELLRSRFPERIRLFCAYVGDEALAGALVYDCGCVLHTQYMHSSPEGKRIGALDLIIKYLADCFKGKSKYLDFGISTECDGWFLNESLIYQKEGFGGRAAMYDCYELPIFESPEVEFVGCGEWRYSVISEGKDIGYLHLEPKDDTVVLRAELDNAFRHLGIGRMLLDFALKQAKNSRHRTITAYITDGDNAATALLRHYGFEEYRAANGGSFLTYNLLTDD